jgi:hypothetical protein
MKRTKKLPRIGLPTLEGVVVARYLFGMIRLLIVLHLNRTAVSGGAVYFGDH